MDRTFTLIPAIGAGIVIAFATTVGALQISTLDDEPEVPLVVLERRLGNPIPHPHRPHVKLPGMDPDAVRLVVIRPGSKTPERIPMVLHDTYWECEVLYGDDHVPIFQVEVLVDHRWFNSELSFEGLEL